MSDKKLEEINSISEFMEKLNKVKDLEKYKNLEKGAKRKYTIDLFYRGQSNILYDLIPSVNRVAKQVPYSIDTLEVAFINKAKNEYPLLFSETDNPLDLLIKLQHYGIPTRLLDITANPLVALFFACRSEIDTDGEIFVFGNQYETYFESPLYHDLAKYMGRSDIIATNHISLNTLFYELTIRKNITNTNIEYYIKSNNGEYFLYKLINDLYFIYPPRLFERLYLQQGHFILLLNDYELGMYDNQKEKKYIRKEHNLFPIPKDHKNIIARYIIPANSKKNLLEELKMLNITETTLFHDDVDKVCENIVEDLKGRYGK